MHVPLRRFPALVAHRYSLLVLLGLSLVILNSSCARKCRNGTVLDGGVCRGTASMSETAAGHPAAGSQGVPEVMSGDTGSVQPAAGASAASGNTAGKPIDPTGPTAGATAALPGPGAGGQGSVASTGVAGNNIGPSDCAPGEQSCSGAAVRQCGADGRWMEATPCPFVCVDGLCTGQCVLGNRQCSANAVQECDEQGNWIENSVCPNVCSDGECTGSCAPGARQCSGTSPQVCNDTGTWDDEAPCQFICSDGMCSGECSPNEVRCADRRVETCDAQGEWQAGASCPFVCVDGACTGQCQPGEARCSGLQAERCGDQGSWEPEQMCPYLCSSGRCTGSCKPGEMQCSSSGRQQLCSASGSWNSGSISTMCGADCMPGQEPDPACDGFVPLTCNSQGQLVRGRIEENNKCGAECTPNKTYPCMGTRQPKCNQSGRFEYELTMDCGAECTPGEAYCDDIQDSRPTCWGSGCEVVGDNNTSAIQQGICTAEGKAQITRPCGWKDCGNSLLVAGCRNGNCVDAAQLSCPTVSP
jgi:hypothetical protein